MGADGQREQEDDRGRHGQGILDHDVSDERLARRRLGGEEDLEQVADGEQAATTTSRWARRNRSMAMNAATPARLLHQRTAISVHSVPIATSVAATDLLLSAWRPEQAIRDATRPAR